MIKIFKLFLITLFLVNTAHASDAIKSSRVNLGNDFNTSVKQIKTDFKYSEDKITLDKDDIDDAKDDIDLLVLSQAGNEANPTILKHGKKDLESCKKYTEYPGTDRECINRHELRWHHNKWIWKPTALFNDCTPSSGEYKIKSGNNYVCVQNGSYKWYKYGYGSCNSLTKLRYARYKCMFKNKKNRKIEYQVAGIHCSSNKPRSSIECTGTEPVPLPEPEPTPIPEPTPGPSSYVWIISDYGSCQSDNIQYRTVNCIKKKTKRREPTIIVDDSLCSGTKPISEKRCNGGCSATGINKNSGQNSCLFRLPAGTNNQVVNNPNATGLCPATNAGDATCTGSFKCSNGVWNEISWDISCKAPVADKCAKNGTCAWFSRGSEVGNRGCRDGDTCNVENSTKVCCGFYGVPNANGGCRDKTGGRRTIDPVIMECKIK